MCQKEKKKCGWIELKQEINGKRKYSEQNMKEKKKTIYQRNYFRSEIKKESVDGWN